MKDEFSSYHPIINFTFFLAIVIFSMFFMHPVFLGISLVASIAYSLILKGRKALKFSLLYMLPTLILIAILNPILNHQGETILLYINDNPLTLQAIIYGVAAGIMFISVITWFSCYNEIMTSDKFIYLFGRVCPALSLIISMALRFVPKFKSQIKEISKGQKSIGRDVSNGNIFQRISNGIKIVSILITWALENAIETADSMKARGYGLKGRTSFSIYKFEKRDKVAFTTLVALIAIVILGAFLGENNIFYYPAIVIKKRTIFSFIVYFAYGLLCFFPILINIKEEVLWRLLK